MFTIYDGRKEFYQWDLDRKLIVNDSTIKEVHFCNKTDDCSLVCETYTEDGKTLVNVPNILLTADWRVNVYAYDGKATKHSATFGVISRTKPSDYVYTETEVKSYEALEKDLRDTNGYISFIETQVNENVMRIEALEKANSESVWELIDTINVEEGVTNLSITQEPDGTPYKFSKMYMRIELKNTTMGGASLFFKGKGQNLSGVYLSGKSTARDYYTAYEVFQDSGVWRGKYVDWTSNSQLCGTSLAADEYTYFGKRTVSEYPVVEEIRISFAFPANSKVTIWGVRADA